jgi:hypothetical protein
VGDAIPQEVGNISSGRVRLTATRDGMMEISYDGNIISDSVKADSNQTRYDGNIISDSVKANSNQTRYDGSSPRAAD